MFQQLENFLTFAFIAPEILCVKISLLNFLLPVTVLQDKTFSVKFSNILKEIR